MSKLTDRHVLFTCMAGSLKVAVVLNSLLLQATAFDSGWLYSNPMFVAPAAPAVIGSGCAGVV